MNRIYKIALTKIKGLGPKLTRGLLNHFETAENVFKSSDTELQKVFGIGSTIAHEIKNGKYLKAAEEELTFIDKNEIQLLWIKDKNIYPRRLSHCEDAPLLLYYKGNADLNTKKIISIVGSRNATTYGLELCKDFIKNLKDPDTLVISGLAYGIDVQAHRSSLDNKIPTVGVLGHGLDRIYPYAHRETAKQILMKGGGLLTEFASGTNPERTNFPMRNRIIAGLSDVTIVVEAAIKGGALITAEIANSYNRDVCAFPGSVHQTYSAGCNYLIKTHRAHLIRNANDLYYLMNWEKEEKKPKDTKLPLITEKLSKDEKKVADYIASRKEDVHVDEIANHCNWPQSKLAIVLLEMELSGHVVSLPGKMYKNSVR